MVEIKEISYKNDRLNFFLNKRENVQKRYHRLEKAIKPDEPYLSDRRQLLSDCGRELSFYNDIISMLKEDISCKFKIVLTAMDSNTSEGPYAEEIEGVFDSRVEAEVYMLHTMNEELSSLNEPDAHNTPHTRVFIADLDGEHDAIIRLWDGDDYWDVTYYDIVEIDE